MHFIAKAAAGAIALTGLVVGTSTPATSAVHVNIGIGAPWGYYSDCGDYWWDPVYVDGVWYQGPICWRWRNGVRVFWLHGRWHRHGWRGAMPRHWRWGHRGFVRWGHHRRPRNWRPHHRVGHGGHRDRHDRVRDRIRDHRDNHHDGHRGRDRDRDRDRNGHNGHGGGRDRDRDRGHNGGGGGGDGKGDRGRNRDRDRDRGGRGHRD